MNLCLQMSRADTYTPISYWYEMPLWELLRWIKILEADHKRQKRAGR